MDDEVSVRKAALDASIALYHAVAVATASSNNVIDLDMSPSQIIGVARMFEEYLLEE